MVFETPLRGKGVVCALAFAAIVGSGAAQGATIVVPAGGDVQAAINAAQPGDVITLAAGATYVGNFVLTNKGSSTTPIVIRSSTADSQLPGTGVRMTPSFAPLLAKLRSPSNESVLRTESGAHHWTVMLLELQANAKGVGDLIQLGTAESSQNQLTGIPSKLVVDRLYVHGDPALGQKRCIALNSADTTIKNSYISDCKAVGQDSQAIAGYNGPGPYLIENNYLEGATETILFGGADPVIPNLVPSNITIRGNYLTKPLAWRNPIIAPPATVSATAAPGGGSLAAGTYAYKVVARRAAGSTNIANSVPATEVSATLSTAGAITISWSAVAGADNYVVYGRTAGGQNTSWVTTALSFTDTGAAGTAGTPPTKGTRWAVKNLFELKNAQDVLIEGNVLENLWVADQAGYAICFTTRNQDGHAPWSVVQRVTFRNNLLRHAAGGINILGHDSPNVSQQTNHITISNNVLDDLTSATWGSGARPFLIGDGADSVVIDHNTIKTTDDGIVSFYGGSATAPTANTNLKYTNNMSAHNSYGVIGDGVGIGLPAINAYMPGGVFQGNVLAGGSASSYPGGNYFPAMANWQGQFVDFAGGNYRLVATSPYKNAGTDGKDLGADFDTIQGWVANATSGDNSNPPGTAEAPIRITGLTASVAYPIFVGTSVTWTATGSNSRPVEYKFYVCRKGTTWVLGRDWSSNNTFMWTPQPGDAGSPNYVQVWARAVGSTAAYDTYLGTSAFDILPAPLWLSSNVDFPTPPGNQVTWTATLGTPPPAPVQYRFQVVDLSTNNTTLLRDYSTSNKVQWTPQAAGRYMIQALERAVGSPAAYDVSASTAPLEVSATPITIKSFTASAPFPSTTGTPITFTARVQGGLAGPLQYVFWIYSTTNGWRNGQPWGPTETFTWTPTWADEGDFAVQVWVRSNGSTATYETYLGTDIFHISRAALKLTTTTLFPAAPGTPVTWTADVPDPSVNMEYAFWVFSGAANSWSAGQSYSTQKSFVWQAPAPGAYAIQVWARQVGSTASSELARSSGLFDVTSGPAQMVSLTSNASLPSAAGTTVTWTAGATGGTAPLEYQFWRQDGGTWRMVQDYRPSNTYTWPTTAADVGQHAVQARVRSIGSASPYEAQMTSGLFQIK